MTKYEAAKAELLRRGFTLTRIAPEDPDKVRERDHAAIDQLYFPDGRRLGDPTGVEWED